MKRLLFLLMVSLVLPCLAFAEDKTKPPIIKGKCPETQVVGEVDDCLKCHITGSFKIKEIAPDAHLSYPVYGMEILNEGTDKIGYFKVEGIESEPIREMFAYFDRHKIKHVILEISSPGGSLFEAWRIIGLMNTWKQRGMLIETRCQNFAASAGFMVFVNGTLGHRGINPHAELMWHELMSFSVLKISTPTSSEDEAKLLRHLQDSGNRYLATRGNLTKEELDKRIKSKELWMHGSQALKDGFADKVLGEWEKFGSTDDTTTPSYSK